MLTIVKVHAKFEVLHVRTPLNCQYKQQMYLTRVPMNIYHVCSEYVLSDCTCSDTTLQLLSFCTALTL